MLKENSFEPQPFWKINTRLPYEVPIEADKLVNSGYRVFSSDMYFTQVHALYRGFNPSSWHKIRAEIVDESTLGDLPLIDLIPKKVVPYRADPPYLTPVSVDIESYNPEGGMPDSSTDPIIVVGVATEPDEDRIKRQMFYGKEEDVLPDLVNYINKQNPDLFWTYNGNDFDIEYLVTRCQEIGSPFRIGINGWVPKKSEYSIYSIRGVPSVDFFGFAQFTGSKRKSQPKVHEWMAKEGMVRRRKHYYIDRDRIAELWDSGQEDEVIKHCTSDITLTHDIGQASLPFTLALSRISKIPLDQCLMVAMRVIMESYLFRFAKRFGYVIPNSQVRPIKKSEGAVVFPPIRGIHDYVIVIDFKSMYPIICIKYNISFETFQDGDWLKNPKGMFPRSLEELQEELSLAKRIYRAKYSSKYAGEIQGIKTIARALSPHGYLGYYKSRWHSLEAKEYELEIARRKIRRTAKVLVRAGYKLLYGDTDSVFIPVKEYDERKFAKICSLVERKTDMEVDWEFIRTIFFTDAKKKYIYLDKEGEIHFSGFEYIRGEWCRLSQIAQIGVARIILNTKDVDRAIRFVVFILETMKKRPLKDFIIAKGLGQDIEDYDRPLAHVEVAKRVGTDISGKVEYVICKKGRLHADKARHPSEMKSFDDIDFDYYREKQVLATAGRILEYFDPYFKQRVRNWGIYTP